jgi:hypothetical protein
MTGRELTLSGAERRGYRAAMGRMIGGVAGVWLVCAAAALFGASSASALPSGAVGGIQDPATQGVLHLNVLASESEIGVRLASATASIDDRFVTAVPFEEGVTAVTLTVPTAAETDGTHSLRVIIENDNGGRFEWERSFEVDNTPPVSTPVVTVSIGSGTILPSPSPGDGGTPPPGGADRSCAFPRLSMFLGQNPLRFRRGVLVLAAGRRYRFRGSLTCRVNGRRRPAARGTLVEVINRVRGRTVAKTPLKVRGHGRLVTRVAYSSSRVLVFRVRGTGGKAVSVKIPIRVVRVRRGRS